ncbi:MAG: DUF1456 family protein [Balneolaceae bacterium]|nr:DUF1456 family protein [Balneolaceae bacterium]MCH8547463.1 DUF1456 family protein [Balneolaceae bacterium]
MRNNDIIQSIRYILDVGDGEIANILRLADYKPKRNEIEMIFEDEDGTGVDATHELLGHFLDGLIFQKRGKSDKHPPQPVRYPISNNDVLKKLRVAFKLRDTDVQKIIELGGYSINKPELNALFRREDHRNYKLCGDQILRYFLKGLALKERKENG